MSEPHGDRISKKVLISAEPGRVWRAISDAAEFGQWFGMRLEGAFQEGATIHGRITHPDYSHLTVEMQIVRLEAPRYFAYRWHPYAIDPKLDYSKEPTTLVEFHLEPAPAGTLLRIEESGFELIPAARRAEAFRMNDGGWAEQAKNIEKYVTTP